MKKFPSINQFRNVIREVKSRHDYIGKDDQGEAMYAHTTNYPVLKFRGTVKLHGTNAAIVKYSDSRVEFQSRENVLSLEKDNANFMAEMHKLDLSFLFNDYSFNEYCAVYGEWCGGNIQAGVAINGLPKMFVIFAVKVDDEWVELPSSLHNNNIKIYNILQFPTYEVDIDFNVPELAQNAIIDMTLAVEECCPVGKFFGKIGVGEGIVFTAVTDKSLRFKSKGEKHSVTKVKTLNPIDTESIESVNDFVESVVTENRLLQGISIFKESNIEIDVKNTVQFLRWVVNDVYKEECDTIVVNNLDTKKVNSAISNKARQWFLNYLN